MKNLMVLIAAISLMAATSYAQYDYGYEEPAHSVSLVISPQLTIPLGDLSDGYGLGFGGVATLGFEFAPNSMFTLSSGYHWLSGEEIGDTTAAMEVADASIIPIMAGMRFAPAPNLYLGAEAGVHGFDGNTEFQLDDDGVGLEGEGDTHWKFAVSPMLGFKSSMGGVGTDLGVAYTWTQDYQYIGARLGFTLGTW